MPPEKKVVDLAAAVEALKSLGIILGSLGSLAVLFFWIGKAIIVARLRAYNLYGVVLYTDEYVQEAGYQFFQDIFTFFQDWWLILLFLLVTSLVVTLIPVGPFSPVTRKDLSAQGWMTRVPMSIVARMRNQGIHYFLFFGLALLTSISLTSNWAVRNLSADIARNEQLLSKIVDSFKGRLFVLVPNDEVDPNPFQQRFHDLLLSGERPAGTESIRLWLSQSLIELYPDARSASLSDLIARFQKDFKIQDEFKWESDEGFKKSITYQTLFNIRLNKKLNEELRRTVETALLNIRQLLSAHLNNPEDFSSLVVIPANYETVNHSIHTTKMLHKSILAFFKPGNDETAKLMSRLLDLQPLRLGSVLLSFSFWVLLGMMAYIFLNTPNVLKFHHLEKGYFFLMLLLFLIIVITLPTAYGRYKFEFKIQKVNDIIFSGDDVNNPIKKKVKELWEKKAALYVLGPTRGKEVMVAAIGSEGDFPVGGLQILVLNRDTYQFMNVEPVRVQDNQKIIQMLQGRVQP